MSSILTSGSNIIVLRFTEIKRKVMALSEEEKKATSLKPILVTRDELRLIIHWKKNCVDSSCPLYSMEGGNAFCESVIAKLVDAFNDWKEEEVLENA